MKTVLSMASTFVVEVTFTDAEMTPQLQSALSDDQVYTTKDYGATSAMYMNMNSPTQADSTLPEYSFLSYKAVVTSGPQRMGIRSFHYPLNVNTVNFTTKELAPISYCADTLAEVNNAIDKIVGNIRMQLEKYEILGGYSINVIENYKGSKNEIIFGPFITPYSESDHELSADGIIACFKANENTIIDTIVNIYTDNGKYPPKLKADLQKQLQPLLSAMNNHVYVQNHYDETFIQILLSKIDLLTSEPSIKQTLSKVLGH